MADLACQNRSHARPLRFEPLEDRALLAGAGLTGQYFHNEDFTGLAFERQEVVDFAWGTDSPGSGVEPTTYSVRWTGQIEAEFSELYQFYTTSNAGVRLWVDGQLLIDNWDTHTAQVDAGAIQLEGGKLYDLRLDYFQWHGSAELKLEWESDSQTRQVVPASHQYQSPTGLWGEYTDDLGGQTAHVDMTINHDWDTRSPSRFINNDYFQVTWSGRVRPSFSEEYTFSIESDDGVRLWIGGRLVIDDWTTHSAHTTSGNITLEAGKWQDLRLEYREDSGNAVVRLMWSSQRQTDSQPQVIPSINLQASKRTSLEFTNPLGPGYDPYVTRYGDYYYLVRYGSGGVWVDRAASLEDIHRDNPNSRSIKVWDPPSGTNYSHGIWAPELHRLNGKWYIYVAADDGNNANHRMHVLERDAEFPLGEFTYKGQIVTNEDRWAIDGTVLEWQNQLYFLWSGWPGSSNGVQNLYIAEMSDPLTISSNRVMISTPTHAWEMHGLSLNEGPQVLINDGHLHIIYSGSGYWRSEYALGRLTYDGVGSLLDPASWHKAPEPVFKGAGDIVGTGHASFTKSPDGAEDWIVYHAHNDPDYDFRVVHIQRFDYNPDGTPDFGIPIPTDTQLHVPAGHIDAQRGLLPGDYNADRVVDEKDYQVWRASYGQNVTPGIGADGNGDGLIDAADYAYWRGKLGDIYVEPIVTSPSGEAASPLSQPKGFAYYPPNDAIIKPISAPTAPFSHTPNSGINDRMFELLLIDTNEYAIASSHAPPTIALNVSESPSDTPLALESLDAAFSDKRSVTEEFSAASAI